MSTAVAERPAAASSGVTADQHQLPCQAPCTSTIGAELCPVIRRPLFECGSSRKRYTIESVRDGADERSRAPSQEHTVAPNLYLVFSKRPEAISAADYDAWYEKHAQENIESPRFTSARRYEIAQVNGPPVPFEHLSVYEYEGPMEQWRTSLTSRIESGEVQLPGWFPQIQFGSWECSPLSGLLQPKTHPGG
jgi:hypothetical protein